MNQSAVVFARTGWMKTFQGSRTQERPVGGGKYNKTNIGVEKDNFLPDAYGCLHGYFSVGKGDQSIDLFRIDGRPETRKLDQLSPVLVIFVATHPNGGGVIVGWYKNARLYRHEQARLDGHAFRIEADAKDAVLVPFSKRDFSVPRATTKSPGMGQSNVYYLFDSHGKPRFVPWAEKAIKYVLKYTGENALDPGATDVADPVTAAEIQQERKAGRASNPKLRKAVEERAMLVVEQHYKDQGIALEDRSKKCSYDFYYTDGGKLQFIEVKGSQLKNPAIILTRNEVEFARRHWQDMELCVVHSIAVDGEDEPKASGGILERFSQWNPDKHELAAIQYECRLDRDLAMIQ
jgi:hypothetical protein